MNTDAMRALAALLENVDDESFKMEEWYVREDANVCGFAACVAGWAVVSDPIENALFLAHMARRKMDADALGLTDSEWAGGYDFFRRGAYILGLGSSNADDLFSDAGWWNEWLTQLGLPNEVENLSDITNKHAALVLRGLADGDVKFGAPI